jgi:hypothetical protein
LRGSRRASRRRVLSAALVKAADETAVEAGSHDRNSGLRIMRRIANRRRRSVTIAIEYEITISVVVSRKRNEFVSPRDLTAFLIEQPGGSDRQLFNVVILSSYIRPFARAQRQRSGVSAYSILLIYENETRQRGPHTAKPK